MKPHARVEVESRGPVTVARLVGELDLANVDELGETLTRSVANDTVGLALDLSGVAYLDSAGVHLLFDLARRLRRRQQELRVAIPGEAPIRRLLDLVDLASVADIDADADASIAALGRVAAEQAEEPSRR